MFGKTISAIMIIIEIDFSWSNGLLFHQAVVDLARSAILIPMGIIIMIIMVMMIMMMTMIIMIIMIMMITNNENDNMTISGQSILQCQPISKCSLVETTFLLLVTVSTVRSSPLLSSSSNYKFLSKVKV